MKNLIAVRLEDQTPLLGSSPMVKSMQVLAEGAEY